MPMANSLRALVQRKQVAEGHQMHQSKSNLQRRERHEIKNSTLHAAKKEGLRDELLHVVLQEHPWADGLDHNGHEAVVGSTPAETNSS
jgi:hypothetical protein